MRKLFSITLLTLQLLLLVNLAQAASVDTVETFSPSMQKKIKAVVIKPATYGRLSKMPVVYLLHGYGNNYAAWIKNVPLLEKIADNNQFMIVCADGNVSSWYFDSPVNPSWKYETYVATELVNWVDANYKTIKDRKGRAITGLSMGGHGALYLTLKHQDVFGAAGSMSGGVDIRPFPNNWLIAEKLGTYAANQDHWEKNTIVNMVHLLTPGKVALIIDCGTDDFFYKVNVNLHELLLERNIQHDFISKPGAHNWAYWNEAIKYQLLYFEEFFEKNRDK